MEKIGFFPKTIGLFPKLELQNNLETDEQLGKFNFTLNKTMLHSKMIN
jgi:hypothetical protein